MVDKKIIDALFSLNSDNYLTTKQLNEIGLNSQKINKCIENNIIKRESRGKYIICSNDYLYYDLYKYILENNIDKIYDISLKIYNSDNSRIDKFLIYLISYIYELNDKFDSIKLEECIYDDEKYKTYNCVVYNSFYKKDYRAINTFDKYVKDKNIKEKIIYILLEKKYKYSKIIVSKVNKMVNERKYEELFNYLMEEQNKKGLSQVHSCILYTLEKYLEVNATNNVPSIKKCNSEKLYDIVRSNNFKKAYDICASNFNQPFSLFVVLEDLNKLIKSKVKKELYRDFIKEISNNCNNIFIITSKIGDYLKAISKPEYFSVVFNYLKLDILNKDMNFNGLKKVCMSLEFGSYSFYPSYYVTQFYYEISKKNIDKACAYLDILHNGDYIGYKCPILDLLDDVLDYTKKYYNSEEINYNKNKYIKVEDNCVDSNISKEDKEYVNNKISMVRDNKRFIKFKKITHDRKELLKMISKKSIDLSYLDFDNYFILFYTPTKKTKIDGKKIGMEAENFYREKKYKDAIDLFYQLLENGQLSSYVMARIGLCNVYLSKKDVAISYLKFATDLNKRSNGKYDFDYTPLIQKLEKKANDFDTYDYKYDVKFRESEFKENNNYYEIKNIDTIVNSVNCGMSITDACLACNLDNEEIGLVHLLFAKEYYMDGDFEIGDRILKNVIKMPNKSNRLIKELQTVHNNKKFYMYRENKENRLIKKYTY